MCRYVSCLLLLAALYGASAPKIAQAGIEDGQTDAEHPFCRDRDDFIKYFLAIATGHDELLPLFKTCKLLRAGIPIEVVSKTTGPSPIGAIAKIRIKAAEGAYLEGYVVGVD